MNNQLTKRRNPFEKPIQQPQEDVQINKLEQNIQNEVIEEEEVMFESPIQTNEPVFSTRNQQQTQYYEQKPTQRVKNSTNNVVTRDTKQYYNVSNEVSRDKFTSTMETNLRRSIKIVCAQRGIMFAQFVEDACREKLRREGVK